MKASFHHFPPNWSKHDSGSDIRLIHPKHFLGWTTHFHGSLIQWVLRHNSPVLQTHTSLSILREQARCLSLHQWTQTHTWCRFLRSLGLRVCGQHHGDFPSLWTATHRTILLNSIISNITASLRQMERAGILLSDKNQGHCHRTIVAHLRLCTRQLLSVFLLLLFMVFCAVEGHLF